MHLARLVVIGTLLIGLTVAQPAAAAVSLGGWMAHSPDDISGFTTLSGNDAVANVTLPFTFTVEGVNYTTLALSTNGWLEFGSNTAGNSDPTNDCLPTPAHTNPFLALYWDDLIPWGTQVRHGTLGTAPNRVWIADYEVDVAPSNHDMRFQVQLHERSNTMTVRYRNSQDQANAQGATIGYQGAGGGAATTIEPLTCNGKILDDNRPDEGWSADIGRAGLVTLSAMTAHSPDDISGFTTLSGNDNVVTVTLPFNVPMEGTTYNTVAISTNGWLEFGGNTAGNSDPTNDCLPSAAHSNPLLAPYWDDLNPFGTQIRYGTVGASPNRTFIVDYEVDLNSGEGDDDLRFQVQIHELSGLLSVRYRDKQLNATGQQATIGFQGAGAGASKAYPMTCNARILDHADEEKDGWSIHPKANGAMSPHGVLAFSPSDLNSTTVPGLQTFNGDDVVQTVGMGFNVVLDGVSYSQVAISTNGWLEFGGDTSGGSDPTNDCLPTSAHTNPFLAAYWDDMRTAGSSNVRYGTIGSAGNRVFLVDYFLDVKTSADDGNDDVEIQVQVHERSNAITLKYRHAQLLAGGTAATLGYQSAGGGSAQATPVGCNARVLDDNRNDAGWSVAPFPVCGNGIVEGLSGETCDQGGANGTATSCCTATCTFRGAGQVCRTGGGAPCDLNETCSGSSGACPTDDVGANAGLTCRIGSGDACDPDELCSGTPGQACPADVVAAGGTTCRIGSGDACDPAEACTGVAGQTCPANSVAPPSTVCRPGSGDACDAHEHCPGLAGGSCPSDDAALNAGVVCRPGSGDACDQNEACTGTPGATCPADDTLSNAGTICRPSSVAGAFCDEPEVCPGGTGSTCPPNDAPLKVNVVCRAGSGDMCDPDERCTGLTGQGCPPDVVMNPTVVCRAGSGDACDPDEHCPAVPGAACPADVVEPAGTVCRADTGVCDVAEECSGTTGEACPADTGVAAGTSCEQDGDLCTEEECNGSGSCVALGEIDCDDGNVCTQDSCDPGSGCVVSGTPSLTCVAADRATFQVKNSANDNGDKLKLGWKGGPVLVPDLGDPQATTTYELCVYDDNAPQMALDVSPGTGWQVIGSPAAPRGYKFKGRGEQDGMRVILLKGSSLNRGILKIVAKGAQLPDPTLPFVGTVVAQLYADDTCWEASFAPAETKKNDAGGFSGKTLP